MHPTSKLLTLVWLKLLQPCLLTCAKHCTASLFEDKGISERWYIPLVHVETQAVGILLQGAKSVAALEAWAASRGQTVPAALFQGCQVCSVPAKVPCQASLLACIVLTGNERRRSWPDMVSQPACPTTGSHATRRCCQVQQICGRLARATVRC